MTNLQEKFCHKVRECRRSAGISQSALAKEVGCKQSALSMFEVGDGTKLNFETIKRIAQKFDIEDLLEESIEGTQTFDAPSSAVATSYSNHLTISKGFCSNPNCPSNSRYEVDGSIFLMPDLDMCDPVGAKFCALCGEVLEKTCPSCGKPIHKGAVCSYCGEKYISI